MSRILITGAASGLGAALAAELAKVPHDHTILPFDRNLDPRDNVLFPEISRYRDADVDVLINCAGINRINWLQHVSSEEWDAVVDTNVKGIFKMTQHFLPTLTARKGTVLNIVSNAAHMAMRCSAAYNASKGAALILTKQLARELSDREITVFSVSPNKLRGTGMSDDIDEQVMKTRGWTREQAQAYQLNGLLLKEETPVEAVAQFIAFLLQTKENHRYLSGCDIPYGL